MAKKEIDFPTRIHSTGKIDELKPKALRRKGFLHSRVPGREMGFRVSLDLLKVKSDELCSLQHEICHMKLIGLPYIIHSFIHPRRPKSVVKVKGPCVPHPRRVTGPACGPCFKWLWGFQTFEDLHGYT